MMNSYKLKSLVTMGTCLLFCNFAMAGKSSIKIANEGADFAPFYYTQKDSHGNEIKTGFELELLNQIMKRMRTGYQLITRYDQVKNLNNSPLAGKSGELAFDDLLPSLYHQTGTASNGAPIYAWDVVSATLGISEQRLKTYDFSNPIYVATKHFFGNQSKVQKIVKIPDDLNGLKIAVEGNTLFQKYAEFLKAELEKSSNGQLTFTIVPLVKNDQNNSPIKAVFAALKAGTVDVMVTDDEVFLAALNTDLAGSSEFAPLSPEVMSSFGNEIFGKAVGLALRKNSPLKAPIDQALAEIIQDCTYKTIYDKYFKIPSPLVKHCN